jgi:hypothetical protein
VIPADALQLAASLGFLVIGTRLLLKASTEADVPDPSSSSQG